jgi:hypothetical protein
MTAPQKAAVRYWEIRRVFFVVLVLLWGHFSWGLSNSFNAGIDGMPVARYSDPGVVGSLIAVFFAANAIYSLGYVAEFFLSGWRFWAKPCRTILFLALFATGCEYAARSAQVLADRLSMHKMIWPAIYGIKRGPNQPPLQTPTSGTPAAGAPVAPPPGAAGR